MGKKVFCIRMDFRLFEKFTGLHKTEQKLDHKIKLSLLENVPILKKNHKTY